jgi:hypothetical protein
MIKKEKTITELVSEKLFGTPLPSDSEIKERLSWMLFKAELKDQLSKTRGKKT